MILKAFKEKSNQKFVERLLTSRNLSVSNKKITSVGVLLNASEFADYEKLNQYLDSLNIAQEKREFLIFSDNEKQEFANWENCFTKKDFGWKGKIKNQSLQNFTETKFGVLICYFLDDKPELNQIAAMSQADFKVGISKADERLYDLIIDITIDKFEIFKKELKKYLTILNKL